MTFGADGVEITFSVEDKPLYATFTITDVKDIPERRVMKMEFPLGSSNSVMAVPLDYMTNKANEQNRRPGIEFDYLWGRNGKDPLGSFALAVVEDKKDADETLLHIWANETLPHPKLSKPWTVKTARTWLKKWQAQFVDQSTMVIKAKTPEQLYRLTDKAAMLCMKKIYLHTDTWRGEYWPTYNSFLHVNRKTFPAGEKDFKKYSEYCHSKGLNVAIHIVSCAIGIYDPDYTKPKLDVRLAGWVEGELESDLDANRRSRTIEFKPALGTVFPREIRHQWAGPNTRYSWMNINMVKVGDELIEVGEFTQTDNDVWVLKNCQRGVNHTTIAPHKSGTAVKGMYRPYSQTFTVDSNSGLLDEVAKRYSEFCNRVGVTHMECDGQEIHMDVPWGTNKFVWKVYENLDHPVTSNTSSGTPLKYQIEYWFNSSKDVWKNHPTGGVAGGDGVPIFLNHDYRPATGPYEILIKPTYRLGVGGRTFNFIRPIPMFGVSEKILVNHGLTGMISGLFPKWRAAAERINPEQIASIKSWFTEKYRSPFNEANNQVATDTLARPETVNGKLALVPLKIMSRSTGELNWGWGQEYGPLVPRQYIKTGEKLELTNPFSAQIPEVLIRVLPNLTNKVDEDDTKTEKLKKSAGEDSRIVDAYNRGAGHGDTAHPLDKAYHIWAKGAVERGMATYGTIAVRKHFELPDAMSLDYVALVYHADDSLKVFFNGQKVFTGGAFDRVQMLDVTDLAVKGNNVAGFEVKNEGWVGCLTAAVIISIDGKQMIIPTDKNWKATANYPKNWVDIQFDDKTWPEAEELGRYGTHPSWGRTPVEQAVSKTNLMPDVKRIKEAGIHKVTAEGKAIRIVIENKSDKVLKLKDKLPKWRTSASMDDARAIGMRVTGDGSGALLVVNVEGRGNREYVVKLDFKGSRNIVIPCGIVAWSDPEWGWRKSTGKISYVSIQSVKMGLGIIPPKTKVDVKVESLRILKESEAFLVNPVIALGNRTLFVKGMVSSGQYLWYSEGSTIGVYDMNWNWKRDLRVESNNFSALEGKQLFSITHEATDKSIWLECQLMVKGSPMVLGHTK